MMRRLLIGLWASVIIVLVWWLLYVLW